MSKGMSTLDPIYGAFSKPPATYPLGVSIAEKVTIQRIDRRAATTIYQAHHSYLPRGRCGRHYGVYLDGRIVGAITFDSWPSEGKIRGFESKDIKEVARVCIAHDTPNLASCAMGKAQDTFLKEHGSGVKLLVTYVREDYSGSMFSALQGKGWRHDGYSEPQTGYSHNDKAEWGKERWVCEL